MKLGEFAQAHSAVTIPKNRLAIDLERLAADMASFEFRAAHAGSDTFDDQRPFQFGDRADDDDDGTAQRSASIEVFAEADELDAKVIQLVEHFEIVPNGAGDAIARPYQDYIELAPTSIGHELVEPGTAWLWRR